MGRSQKTKVTGKAWPSCKLLDAGQLVRCTRFAGTRIPTLAEALDTIQAGSMTLIERKGGEPATCVDLLKQKKLLEQVVVQSFDWDYLGGCHNMAPNLVLGALGSRELTPGGSIGSSSAGPASSAGTNRDLNEATIEAIHARGLKAWVWTVDEPAEDSPAS